MDVMPDLDGTLLDDDCDDFLRDRTGRRRDPEAPATNVARLRRDWSWLLDNGGVGGLA